MSEKNKQLSIEQSLKNKFKAVKKLFNSFEFKLVLVLFVLVILSTGLILYSQGYRVRLASTGKLFPPVSFEFSFNFEDLPNFEARNNYCITLGEEMNPYFQDKTLSCNCYFEVNSTGDPKLDSLTSPLCTCNCTNSTTTTIISVRA